jgi:hypothetical protein
MGKRPRPRGDEGILIHGKEAKMKTMTKTRLGKIALARLAFALMGAGAWAKPKSVATYKFTRELKETTAVSRSYSETLDFTFKNGLYGIQVAGYDRYSDYAIGYTVDGSNWYIYSDKGWSLVPKEANNAERDQLKTVYARAKAPVESAIIRCQNTFGTISKRAYCEVSISDCFIDASIPYSAQVLRRMPKDGYLPEPLPGYSDQFTDAFRGDCQIVLALKGTTNKKGVTYPNVGIVFTRTGSVFKGEKVLFEETGDNFKIGYISKTLSFFNLFFETNGATDFRTSLKNVTGTYESAKWNVNYLDKNKQRPTEYLQNFATMMHNGLTADWIQSVNGKSVFGNPDKINAFNCLYGVSRFPYAQFYLMYLWDKNRPVFASRIRSENPALYNPEN